MKCFKLILFAGLMLVSGNLDAFDWQVRTNRDLFDDMLEYASAFADSTRGTGEGRVLKRFVRMEKKRFSSDEFAWLEDTYDVAKKLERICPPCPDDGSRNAKVRRSILRLVEFPIHEHDTTDIYSQTSPGNQDPGPEQRDAFEEGIRHYLGYSWDALRAWLSAPAPADGELAVFRVYNMGYVFRTAERCFAIDLGRWIPDDVCEFVASHLDVLFLTHPHNDHYYKPMLNAMLSAGKYVFLPKDVIPESISDHKTVMWRDVYDPVDYQGITVCMFAGNQSPADPSAIPANVYHLEFDGWTVTHSGDNKDRFRESRLGELKCPDVAICASWNEPKITMSAIKNCPDFDRNRVVFLPSHENEYRHRVMQRESWWEDFTRPDRYADSDYEYLPCIFLDNGESILLKK